MIGLLQQITPAPWTPPRCYPGRVKGHTDRIAIYGNHGRTTVFSGTPLSPGGTPEMLANARLIGAAPDLYAAASAMADALARLRGMGEDIPGELDDAEDALHRALARAENDPAESD